MLQKKSHYKGHNSSIYKIIRFDEENFLSAAGDGYIVKWSANGESKDGQLLASIDAKVFSVAIAKDRLLLIGDMNGRVFWVDFENNVTLKNCLHHRKGVYAMAVVNGHIFTGGGDGFVIKWDTENMRPLESRQVSHSAIRHFHRIDNTRFLIGSSDGCIYQLNIGTMEVQEYYAQAHTNSIFCLASNGTYLYSGGRDAHINQYDLFSGELIKRIPAHWFTVNDMINLQNKNELVSVSRDKKIRLWNSENLSLLQSIDLQSGGHVNSVNSVYQHAENKRIFTAGDDRSIIGFDVVNAYN